MRALRHALALMLLAQLAPTGRLEASAARDAAAAALLLRQSPAEDGKEATLAWTFDAARARRDSAPAASGRFRRTRNLLRVEADEALRDAPRAMPELRFPAVEADLGGRLGGAVRAAFGPWRTLIDAAWGGSWAGAAILQVLTAHEAPLN